MAVFKPKEGALFQYGEHGNRRAIDRVILSDDTGYYDSEERIKMSVKPGRWSGGKGTPLSLIFRRKDALRLANDIISYYIDSEPSNDDVEQVAELTEA